MTKLAKQLWRSNQEKVIYTGQSAYQKIILTESNYGLTLYLDGNMQFCSFDEYRYHEALVHPAMALCPSARRILILGGGDGLAARELLKYDLVEEIVLVDLDPEICRLSAEHPQISLLNQRSLQNPKVTVINTDAWEYIADPAQGLFDVVFIDLPDPAYEALNRLYSLEFYQMVSTHLPQHGLFVTQSASPTYDTTAFWTIHSTVAATGLPTYCYHVDVPSFCDWGFTMAAKQPLAVDKIKFNIPTLFLDEQILPTLFIFGKDVRSKQDDVVANTLDNPVLWQLCQNESLDFDENVIEE